ELGVGCMRRQVLITGGVSCTWLHLGRVYWRHAAPATSFCVQSAEQSRAGFCTLCRAQNEREVALDVYRPEHVQQALAEASRDVQPDVMIHCAGSCVAADFEAIDDDTYARVININLVGSRNVVAGALPHLKSGSQLVLIASMAGLVGCYGYAAYCASKYGVVGLAEVLRIELAQKGIDVTVVCPPEVETPMVEAERLNRPKQTEALKLMAGTLPLDYAVRQIRKGIDARRFMVI